MTIRTALLLLALAAGLTGCSKATFTRVEVDLVSFLAPADRSTSFQPVTVSGTWTVPDADGWSSSEIGAPSEAYANLAELAITGEVTVTPTGLDTPIDVHVRLFVGQGATAFTEAALEVDTTIATDRPTVVPIVLRLTSAEDPARYEQVRSGDFQVGAEIEVDMTGDPDAVLDLELTGLDVSVGVQMGTLMPF